MRKEGCKKGGRGQGEGSEREGERKESGRRADEEQKRSRRRADIRDLSMNMGVAVADGAPS